MQSRNYATSESAIISMVLHCSLKTSLNRFTFIKKSFTKRGGISRIFFPQTTLIMTDKFWEQFLGAESFSSAAICLKYANIQYLCLI